MLLLKQRLTYVRPHERAGRPVQGHYRRVATHEGDERLKRLLDTLARISAKAKAEEAKLQRLASQSPEGASTQVVEGAGESPPPPKSPEKEPKELEKPKEPEKPKEVKPTDIVFERDPQRWVWRFSDDAIKWLKQFDPERRRSMALRLAALLAYHHGKGDIMRKDETFTVTARELKKTEGYIVCPVPDRYLPIIDEEVEMLADWMLRTQGDRMTERQRLAFAKAHVIFIRKSDVGLVHRLVNEALAEAESA
jgi:hypothetical protein